MRLSAKILLLFCLGAPVFSQVTFQLKNVEAEQLLVAWVLPGPPSRQGFPSDGSLALATRHRLAPGETLRLSVEKPQAVAVVFVPWRDALGFASLVSGGWLLAAQMPEGKQLQLDAAGLAVLTSGRLVQAPLQDWGLPPPRFAVDGSITDWGRIPPLAEFSRRFLAWNHPLNLRVALRDEALWLAFELRETPGTGAAGSVMLRAPDFLIEVVFTGTENRVWLFPKGDDSARSVGSRMVSGRRVEAWLPLERLNANERESLLRDRLEVLSLAETSAGADNARMVTFSLDELP